MAFSRNIKTARLMITPFTEDYITPRYLGWLNDSDLMRCSEQRHHRHTRNSSLAYLKSFDGTSNYFWAIIETQNGLGHIGNINAYVDEPNRLADIGILIGEKNAGRKGYGLEAWCSVCTFLAEDLKMRKISAGTMATNLPMRRIMEKAGMIEDGIRKAHFLFGGNTVDIVHMALFPNKNNAKEEPK